MNIRQGSASDISDIVSIHMSAFRGFFLTILGESFLKFYHTSFLKSDETVTLVAEDKGKIYGFAAACVSSKGFNSRLVKQNLVSFGLQSMKLLFTNPSALLHLARNLTKKSDSVRDDEAYAELFSIGVLPSAQGKGIGKALMERLESELVASGVEKISLTTDYFNNEKAMGLYRKSGYEVLYEFTAYPDRKMYRMIKTLTR